MKISKEIGYVILAEMLILVPSISHIILSSRITSPMRIPLSIISAVFGFIDTFLLLYTSFKNPGRCSKCFTSEEQPGIVELGQETFSLKVCPTCKTLKDLRTHHCKVCDFCVDRLDHHCPWVANCIGRHNHRQFVLLLIFTTLHSCYLLIVNSLEMAFLDPPPGNYGGEIILIIISVVLGWSLASLLGYQLYLISKNMTTHEHRRKLFKKNPFSTTFCSNCMAFWKMTKEQYKFAQNDNKC